MYPNYSTYSKTQNEMKKKYKLHTVEKYVEIVRFQNKRTKKNRKMGAEMCSDSIFLNITVLSF